MSACSYGAVPDPSKPAAVYVSTADFQRWLGPTIYGKLAPWVWEQGTQGYEVAALAALNPDTPGPITDLEVTIASSNPISAMLFASRLKDFGRYMAFYENCLCKLASGTCVPTMTLTDTMTAPTGSAYVQITRDFQITPGVPCSFQWQGSWSGGDPLYFIWRWWSLDGLTSAAIGDAPPAYNLFSPAGPITNTFTPPSWADHIAVEGCFKTRPARAVTSVSTVTNDCGGGVTPTVAPAPVVPTTPTYPAGSSCATVADVCTKLDQVLSMIQTTKRDVDIIQRQSVPFAYIGGPSHAVSGHGEFAVADLLGLAVTFTAIPGRLPVEIGTPDTIWQLGRITLGTADGWQRNITLTHSPALVVPVSGFVTRVGYTLPLGVAATIQELRAEP